MKSIYLIIILGLLNFSYAQEFASGGGNGGDILESEKVLIKRDIQMKLSDIASFFQNYPEYQKDFNNFNFKKALELIKENRIQIDIVEEKPKDKYGRDRSAVNYPNEKRIEYYYYDLKKAIDEDNKALYVLHFHELGGLVGVEEADPDNEFLIDDYSESSKLARYLGQEVRYVLRPLEYGNIEFNTSDICLTFKSGVLFTSIYYRVYCKDQTFIGASNMTLILPYDWGNYARKNLNKKMKDKGYEFWGFISGDAKKRTIRENPYLIFTKDKSLKRKFCSLSYNNKRHTGRTEKLVYNFILSCDGEAKLYEAITFEEASHLLNIQGYKESLRIQTKGKVSGEIIYLKTPGNEFLLGPQGNSTPFFVPEWISIFERQE